MGLREHLDGEGPAAAPSVGQPAPLLGPQP